MQANPAFTRYPCKRLFRARYTLLRETDSPTNTRSVPPSCRVLAQNTRLLRVMHGWSQERLAFEAGLDRSFVGAIERAERNLTFATAEKIAGAFGISLTDLLTWRL